MKVKNYEVNNVREEEVKIVDGEGFKVSGWGYRHQQCVILFFCLTIAYSMRACMGVSLVDMTDVKEREFNHTGVNDTSEEFEAKGILNALMLTPPYPKFRWNKKIQDTILSSFFWGYMVLQIPAGQLAHRFGARYLLTAAMMINCVVSICMPWAALYGGWICTSICRLIQGLSQACIIPGMHTFFGKWAPLHERGRLASLSYGGQALGPVLGLPITGFLASSSLGWPGIFRFYGVLSGLMGGLLWWLGADSPAQHLKISMAERRYIEEGLGQSHEDSTVVMKVPWSKIVRCRGLYAIIIAHIGQTWGQLTLYSEVPAYMQKVIGVNIKANGMLTALPFLMMFFTNFFFSWFTDYLIVNKMLSVTNTRKLGQTIGCLPAALGLLIIGFVPQNIYIIETILVFIGAFKISAHTGFLMNHIDITPNFAGTMMSLSNFTSNLIGSLAPLVAAFILTDVTDPKLWRQVFLVSSGLYFFTNLIYVVLGTAEKAEWNEPERKNNVEDGQETVAMLKTEKLLNNDKKKDEDTYVCGRKIRCS